MSSYKFGTGELRIKGRDGSWTVLPPHEGLTGANPERSIADEIFPGSQAISGTGTPDPTDASRFWAWTESLRWHVQTREDRLLERMIEWRTADRFRRAEASPTAINAIIRP
jgi:hypothetical protein